MLLSPFTQDIYYTGKMEEPTYISPFNTLIETFMLFLVSLDKATKTNTGDNADVLEKVIADIGVEAIETLRSELFHPAQLPHYLPEINQHSAKTQTTMNMMWLIRKASVSSDTILTYTNLSDDKLTSEPIGENTYVITFPFVSQDRCVNILIVMKEGNWYICGKQRKQDYYECQRGFYCFFDLLLDIVLEIKKSGSDATISNTVIFTRSFDCFRDIETLNNIVSFRKAIPDSNIITRVYDSFTTYLYYAYYDLDDVTGEISHKKQELANFLSEGLRLETLPQYLGSVPIDKISDIFVFTENNDRPFQWFICDNKEYDGEYYLCMKCEMGFRVVRIMCRDGHYMFLNQNIGGNPMFSKWETRQSFFRCLLSALMSGLKFDSDTGYGINFNFRQCDVFNDDFRRYWHYRTSENKQAMQALLRNCSIIPSFLDADALYELEHPPVQNTLIDVIGDDEINDEPIAGPGNEGDE